MTWSWIRTSCMIGLSVSVPSAVYQLRQIRQSQGQGSRQGNMTGSDSQSTVAGAPSRRGRGLWSVCSEFNR